jgi:hypothetical protein
VAYIGRPSIVGNFVKLDAISVVNGQAAYTMQNGSVNFTDYSTVNQFLVSLNGTIQAPTSSFTVSGSTLTFASNLATGDVIDFIMVFGNSLSAGTPSDATVSTAKLADNAVTAAKITDATITSAKLASGTVQNQSAFKNILINGDMSQAQRGTSTSSVTSTGYYTCDRWNWQTDYGTVTLSQDTDVPTGQGFAKSFKADVTTAGTVSNGGTIKLRQNIEGQMLQHLKKGTSSAESITISFWIKSTKTGTYICELYDPSNTRQISKSYTVSSSNTWEKKELTFAGDTSGAFTNDNASRLQVTWYISAGSDYTSGTLSTSWTSSTNANRAVGQVDAQDSASNNIYFTGIQMEIGSSASDFEFLPIDINLQRCLRYFQQFTDMSTLGVRTTTEVEGTFNFLIPMRASPSAAQSGVKVFYDLYGNEESQSSATVGFATGSVDVTGCFLNFGNMSSLTQGRVMNPVSGITQFSSEL